MEGLIASSTLCDKRDSWRKVVTFLDCQTQRRPGIMTWSGKCYGKIPMMTPSKSCRDRLQPRDFHFLARVLTGRDDPGGLEGIFLDPENFDLLLDDDKVFHAVVDPPGPLGITPELYFLVLVRKNLHRAGIHDSLVSDYVAGVLAGHAHGEPLAERRERNPGVDFTYHLDFLKDLEGAGNYERFFLQVQCGNHFLWLSGLFPQFLQHRSLRRGAPDLRYYESVARNAFLEARHHPLAVEFELDEVYRRLTDCFGETRQALNLLAENHLFL